jgi:hypothetical protein
MAAKGIHLASDLTFDSIAQARIYFRNILNSATLDQHVSPGEFQSLSRLYGTYCVNTNWPTKSPPIAFYPTLEQGRGFTTKCFGVEFKDGTKGRFSLDKALSSVANAGGKNK